MREDFLIFVALGNPGKKYSKTRHNVGFIVLDYFINLHRIINQDYKFSSIIKIVEVFDRKVACVFPLTYMNLSGVAVKQILDYYKLQDTDKRILVIHDDMDLNLGEFKLKFDGGDAGHNGIKSIINYIGKNFYRLKVGISKPLDKDYKNYVLQEFSKEELITLSEIIPMLSKLMENIVKEGFDLTISKQGTFFINIKRFT